MTAGHKDGIISDAQLIEAARLVPTPQVDVDRSDYLRRRVLEATAESRRCRPRVLWGLASSAGLVVACVALWVISTSGGSHGASDLAETIREPSVASGVEALRGTAALAASSSVEESDPQMELGPQTIDLSTVSATLDLGGGTPCTRCRIRTDQGVVDADGARAKIVVTDGALKRVAVYSGRVTVRVRDQTHVVIAGQSFRPRVGVSRTKTISHPDKRSKSSSIFSVDATFSNGWAAFRAGNYEDARKRFRRIVRHAPSSPFTEDARFWIVMICEREHDGHAAIVAMQNYLSHHSRAERAGQVAFKLATRLKRLRRTGEAARWFRFVLAHRDTRFHMRARDGMQAIGGSRTPP